MSGKVITEGDKVLKANIARQLSNVDGTGIKVGIISTSFNAQNQLAEDVNSGDLPGAENPNGKTAPVQILKDIEQDSLFADDEGRALAQIIHDIAPGAELYFHSFIGGEGKNPTKTNDSSYAEAVDNLVAAEVDIIIDDARLPTTIYQDGQAAEAVEKAIADGVIYVSATDAGLVQADRAVINSFVTEHTGTESRDIIIGTSDAENFYGKEGNDLIQGNGGNDYLLGEGGRDILVGGSGNDVLLGGEGRNLLIGGKDRDTFVLDRNGYAFISDFKVDEDTLAISGMGESELTFSALGNNFTRVESEQNTVALLSGVTSNNLDVLYI